MYSNPARKSYKTRTFQGNLENKALLSDDLPINPPLITKNRQSRANSLDALRGLAMLAMILAFLLPDTLPNWMYEAQRPHGVFDPTITGITWVDIVFPVFLFCMGASIPLSVSKTTHEWDSKYSLELDFYPSFDFNGLKNKEFLIDIGKLLLRVGQRGLLLFAFAIIEGHIRPHMYGYSSEYGGYLLALLGFVLLFPMYVRFSDSQDYLWKFERLHNERIQWAIRAVGWIPMILLVALAKYKEVHNTEHFSLYRSDSIILIIANCWVAATLIWVISRENPNIRHWVVAVLLALRFAANYPVNYHSWEYPNWIQSVWNHSPLPWLTNALFFQYLCIVLPATEIGDYLENWLNYKDNSEQYSIVKWRKWRYIAIAVTMLGLCGVVLAGLSPNVGPAKGLLWTTGVSAGLSFIAWLLLRWPITTNEFMLHDLFEIAMPWFWLGLLSEPYWMGIQRDPSTPSYYFVTFALSVFLLITISTGVECFNLAWLFRPLIDNGQNPMITYAGVFGLILPVLKLFQLQGPIDRIGSPAGGFFVALLFDILLALFTMLCTKLKIVWRT